MMKSYLAILFLTISVSALSQSRTSGRMVVPIGYESYDSLRLGFYGAGGIPIISLDSIGCKFDFEWAGAPDSNLLGP